MIGSKPAWELWAESQMKEQDRGAHLLAKGGFTVDDYVKKTGWTANRARKHLAASGLKWEVANDARKYKNPRVRFYLLTP